MRADDDMVTTAGNGISRRALLAGAGVGGVALGVGLPGSPVAAVPPVRAIAPNAAQTSVATATQPGLRYLTLSGCDVRPLDDVLGWSADSGTFRFRTTGNAYASLPCDLPVGSVLREIEVYVTTAPLSAMSVLLAAKRFSDGVLQNINAGVATSGAALSAVTVAAEFEVTAEAAPVVLLYLGDIDAGAGATQIHGARIAYEPAPSFVPFTPVPRPYNTRDTAGLTKLDVGEERTITLPVPPSASAAVLQLTVTETGPGGFVAVYPAGTGWPGNSSINWSGASSNVGNTVITAVSPNGQITIRGGGSPTHVIVDVPGYLL